ncbi:MAG: glutamate 5-kinase [Sphaerochaetaceae bacterium]|nr:glutamate 5-kinase [Sphaerochaetaceae bacterium]MDC7238333.1 glutamate 5-kinase [Sphaerochaetaceae bacterium]MDC7251098.1 glutamate 5-kinase [Sphaerochaetaceae bacterium]
MSRDFSNTKRIVVKVGTNLLSSETKIDENRIEDIVKQIAKLRNMGYQVVLVTSGAIGMGAKELKIKHSVKDIAMRQALASIGQPVLMSSYRKFFKKHNIVCSQVLITRKELDNRKTYVNLRNSIFTLLDLGIVPILNENDSISTAEIGSAFGDNDRMSALVASKIDAQLLIILTDIDGLYNDNPNKNPSAKLIKEISQINDKIMNYAKGAGSTFSTGGMKTKLLAAKIASIAGCNCVIASGMEDNPLIRIVDNEDIGTFIHSKEKKSQRARWIINSTTNGSIRIDAGAKNALENHKSLLPSGIIEIEGVFEAGDVIEICDEKGLAFAKAVPYYDSTDILAISGHNSCDIENLLGPGKKAVIFRPEDLVFIYESN